MDLSRLAQFPVEIEICKGDTSICVRIEEEAEKKKLKKMIAQEAVKYAVTFRKLSKWSERVADDSIENYVNNALALSIYADSTRGRENISNQRIVDYLSCKMSGIGEIVLHCRVFLK